MNKKERIPIHSHPVVVITGDSDWLTVLKRYGVFDTVT